MITRQAVLIAIGIDWDGRRQVLAVELANRESRSSWRDFLLALNGSIFAPHKTIKIARPGAPPRPLFHTG